MRIKHDHDLSAPWDIPVISYCGYKPGNIFETRNSTSKYIALNRPEVRSPPRWSPAPWMRFSRGQRCCCTKMCLSTGAVPPQSQSPADAPPPLPVGQALNALSLDMINHLSQIYDDAKNDPFCKVVMLYGASEKAFCAGGVCSFPHQPSFPPPLQASCHDGKDLLFVSRCVCCCVREVEAGLAMVSATL